MAKLRSYVLNEARERVLKLAKLRRPQREAFEAVHALIGKLDEDIAELSSADLALKLREQGFRVPDMGTAEFSFELATGVGKTRLMGALIAYLYRAGQSRNAVILAPRAAILEKLERETQVGSAKYLLLDPALVPEPNLCFRSTLESFAPDPDRLNLFVLSPQTITGGDRRFARANDFGGSIQVYLREVKDLVVYVDESHHIGAVADDETSSWADAVRELLPRVQFGFTATPRKGGVSNSLQSYGLGECLREGLYTKAVKLWPERAPDDIEEDDWDRVTLDFGLQRLRRKRAALERFADANADFPFVEPVMLVAARDTAHAEEVAKWLIDRRGYAKEEVHVAHSHRRPSEEELKKLVAIDRPDNKIKIVVNVYQLSEGWDVTNVYVVVPLRSMATYQNAIQSMGRGLRLPAGKRVGDPEVDTLDVLCFGRESFENIVSQAIAQFGEGADGAAAVALGSKSDDVEEDDGPTKIVSIAPRRTIELDVPNVVRVPPEPNLDFEIAKAPKVQVVTGIDLATMDRSAADDEPLKYATRSVVRNATLRVLADLAYLSPGLHTAQVEKLVRDLLLRLGADEEGEVAIDPVKVALLVGEEIDRRYKQQAVAFKLLDGTKKVLVGEFEWRVPETFEAPIPSASIRDWQ
jgi:superfamily II DNA or RNA helicase